MIDICPGDDLQTDVGRSELNLDRGQTFQNLTRLGLVRSCSSQVNSTFGDLYTTCDTSLILFIAVSLRCPY